MKWISVKERLPEIGTSVLVTDGKSDWFSISWRYDYNKFNRDKARIRKDKYPEKIVWNTGCCCAEFNESSIHYWAEIESPKDSE